MTQKISQSLFEATSKITNVADFLLNEEGQQDWEVDAIHLTPKGAAPDASERVVCKYVFEHGRWVLKCHRED